MKKENFERANKLLRRLEVYEMIVNDFNPDSEMRVETVSGIVRLDRETAKKVAEAIKQSINDIKKELGEL